MSQISSITVPRPYARLGANHGYSIDGDVALLHADVEVLTAPPLAVDWALQLWACDSPHTGGPLSGVKVAEAALTRDTDVADRCTRLDAEAQARVPGGLRDYAMVLVLASGEGGHFNQVHDFANYPARQRFITPHFVGSVGYQIECEHLVLNADAIHNPRGYENLSGSLSLELWALAEPYSGGTFEGHALGRIDVGRLAGQCSLPAVTAPVPFSPPPTGNWEVVMMLREWAGPAGYVTRDYARFAVPYVVGTVTATSAHMGTVVPPLDAASLPVVAGVSTEAAKPKTSAPARVSINKASAAQLKAIKGLSKKVASEIVDGRPYASIEELLEVRGIGPKLLDKLRRYLAL